MGESPGRRPLHEHTVNEDGSVVLIEAVFFRHHNLYKTSYDTIREAISALAYGEEYGSLSSVGVFVEGKPHSSEDTGVPPTVEQSELMAAIYLKAKDEW